MAPSLIARWSHVFGKMAGERTLRRSQSMTTTIKGIVRNGRIEVDQPLNLPDGTELTIPIPSAAVSRNGSDERSDTHEEIEAWIRWYDSLEPIVLTADERAAWEAPHRSAIV
jgi:hypothetical protein